jgi:hypothetical protein
MQKAGLLALRIGLWRLLSAVACLGILIGCAKGYPLAVVGLPDVKVDRPLPGEVAVMLPFDVRPSAERRGKQPDIEAVVVMPYVSVMTTRGNFVTNDHLYAVPYDTKEAEARFGCDPVVAAAIGENIVTQLTQAGIFEGTTRLRPGKKEGKTWRLPEAPASWGGERIPPDGKLWEPSSAERQARQLEARAAVVPLPACAAPWLLRVRILHFYATFHQKTVTVTTSSSTSYGSYTYTRTESSSNVTNFPPVANVVLDCELFHLGPQPTLVWQRVVRGVANGSLDAMSQTYELVVPALQEALNSLVRGLADDVPRVRAYLERSAGGPA